MTISYNVGTHVPIIQYDGASTVPDFTNALNMALGIAGQYKQKQDQKQATELAGQLGGMGAQDFLQSPEASKQFARLQQLDPQMAQYTMQLMGARDEMLVAQAAKEAEDAKNTYRSIYELTKRGDHNEVRQMILEKAAEVQSKGGDISKLMEMVNMKPDERAVRALRHSIMAGDVSALAGNAEEQMKLQKMQLDMMSTQQQMGLREREFALKQEAADQKMQVTAEKQDAANKAKESANQTVQAQAQFIDEQTKLAADQMNKAWEGRTGQFAAFVSPTGDTANLRRTLETITANVGFGELMRMKRESPTGGALGSVSERELSLLNATMGNLDAIQSDEELLRVLNQVRSVFSRISEASGGEALPAIEMPGKSSSGGGRSGQGGKRVKFGELAR